MKDKRNFFLVLILCVTILLSGCQRYRQSGTYIWIDVPVNDLTLSNLQPIKIEGHASSHAGISKIEIFIDGALFTTLNNPQQTEKLAIFQSIWSPETPGEHIIIAGLYNDSDYPSHSP
jgi:hypothetical protein